MIQVDLEPKVMDKFVFAIVQKRSSGKLHKELLDLVSYCYVVICELVCLVSTCTDL